MAFVISFVQPASESQIVSAAGIGAMNVASVIYVDGKWASSPARRVRRISLAIPAPLKLIRGGPELFNERYTITRGMVQSGIRGEVTMNGGHVSEIV